MCIYSTDIGAHASFFFAIFVVTIQNFMYTSIATFYESFVISYVLRATVKFKLIK